MKSDKQQHSGSTEKNQPQGRVPSRDASWSETSVRIVGAAGVSHHVGYTHPSAPGLAVTHMKRYGWRVTHLASGCSMLRTDLDTAEHARRVALAIAPLVDFTGEVESWLTSEAADQIGETVIATLEALGYRVADIPQRTAQQQVRRARGIAQQARAIAAKESTS